MLVVVLLLTLIVTALVSSYYNYKVKTSLSEMILNAVVFVEEYENIKKVEKKDLRALKNVYLYSKNLISSGLPYVHTVLSNSEIASLKSANNIKVSREFIKNMYVIGSLSNVFSLYTNKELIMEFKEKESSLLYKKGYELEASIALFNTPKIYILTHSFSVMMIRLTYCLKFPFAYIKKIIEDKKIKFKKENTTPIEISKHANIRLPNAPKKNFFSFNGEKLKNLQLH